MAGSCRFSQLQGFLAVSSLVALALVAGCSNGTTTGTGNTALGDVVLDVNIDGLNGSDVPNVGADTADSAVSTDSLQPDTDAVDSSVTPGDAVADAADATVCAGDEGCPCTQDTDCKSEKCIDKSGTKTCGPVCKPTDPPTEVCDGVDNDCNGKTDESTCNDSNPCTVDLCNASSPTAPDTTCTHTAAVDGTVCEDGSKCTEKDACAAGSCVGSTVNCDDNNPCTDDACDMAVGCSNTNNTKGCDDKEPCTSGDTCTAGACVSGKPTQCDDGNPCTDDACNLGQGCTATDNTKACDDGSKCTDGDTCKAGSCVPGIAIECNDDNGCTNDSCNPAVGCTTTDNNSACEDGNACTTGDTCAGGKCAPGAGVICNDENPCTDDSCDMAKGCTATANTAKCDDNNKCTQTDTCAGGVCLGTSIICDDKEVCTIDACDPAIGCTTTNADGNGCQDGSACTTTDFCNGGKCQGGSVLNCDDGNVCTDDSCDPAKGCVNLANTASCTDNNACTAIDSCVASKCVPGSAPNCEDNQVCTKDSCDVKVGCVNAPLNGPCTDGNACTTADACSGGSCVGGASLNCDDKNPCTDDSCDQDKGCINTNNGNFCSDNNLCTDGDMCVAGVCKPGSALNCADANPCTDDSCDPISGCVQKLNSIPCTDNNPCTTGDACSGGSCQSGGPTNCDDLNPCTKDSCAIGSGCVNVNDDTAPCTDGNVCTTGDACTAGVCKTSGLLKCDDGNPCTTDSCDKIKGCGYVNVADKTACDDGNPCTLTDVCTTGKCAGVGVSCDDANPCTDDACDPVTKACAHVNNVKPCNDNNACTNGDICAAGKCAGPTPVVCDDLNGCTVDSCDIVKGCAFAATANCVGLPYSITFACNDPAMATWKLDAVNAGLGWAVDATPNPPGFKSPSCSLNYNNGVDYNCVNNVPDNAYATGPLMDATQIKVGTVIRLVFQLGGVWEIGGNYDNLDLEASTDGKVFTKLTTFASLGQPTYDARDYDISAYAGKLVQFRFRFWTSDCIANNTSGSFIDDLKVVVGGCKVDGDCNDNDPCSTDTCTVATGKCTHAAAAAGVACDDGNACTTGEKCNTSACVPGVAVVCNDNNPCTDDSCDVVLGCVYTPNKLACDDANACTVGDVCAAGKCVPGTAKNCDDTNSCTTDSCVPASGCKNTVLAGSGQPVCDGLVYNGHCYHAYPKAANYATAESACVAWGGGGHLASVSDVNENAFVRKTADGYCGTLADAWIGGNDLAVQGVWAWSDGTLFSYANWAAGEPNNAAIEKAIEIYNTSAQWNNLTATNALGCYVCERVAPPACDDGNVCTTGELCMGLGVCTPAGVVNCNDNDPCTDDSCDPVKSCLHVNNKAPCDDGSACTTADTCAADKCVGVAKLCDDLNVCTNDSCDPKIGCVNTVVPGSGVPACDGTTDSGNCYKANKNTQTWANAEAACVAWGGGGHLVSIASVNENGLVRKIADGICGVGAITAIGYTDQAKEGAFVWTDGTKALYTNWSPGEPNNAGGAENWAGMYDVGTWNDFNAATAYPCFVCKRPAPTVTCNDNSACTTADVCDASGKCVGSLPPNCDDGNPCTNDSCDAVKGCVHTNNTAACDDGNACTTGDICGGGVCAGPNKTNCDDGNVCTTDACDVKLGCSHVAANGAVCNDANACTTVDKCDATGKCVGSVPPVCNDNVACTVDSCDVVKGCVATVNHDVCVGGDKLTPSCSTVTTAVCAADPYCCNNAWDGTCVNEVRTVGKNLKCNATFTCAHSMCVAGVKLTGGCDAAGSNCATAVCAKDPFCCSTSWDGLCVGEVSSVCGLACQ